MTDRQVIIMLIEAWEALPEEEEIILPNEVQSWLRDHMTPAINEARKHVGRSISRREQHE